jgi:fructokinase
VVDVICIGEMLIDFVPTTAGVGLADVPAFKKIAGGAPANVAVGLARLGVSSGFMGKVGADGFGRFLARTLAEEGVDNRGLALADGANTTLAFVSLGDAGEREFMFYRGADALFAPDDVDETMFDGARLLHFGSYSLTSPSSRAATLHAVATAQRRGLLVSYDPNLRLDIWPDAAAARAGMLAGWREADIVKISLDEVAFLAGPGDPVRTLRGLWHDRLRLVAITLGAAGCRYVTADADALVEGFKVEPIDTNGAGDAFMSGLLAGLLGISAASWDAPTLARICRFANAVGALTTTRSGAIPALPTRQAVDSFLDDRRDRESVA